jgi:hyperosmotically inducible periplasmic protein
MRQRAMRLVLATALVVGLCGCTAMTGESAKRNVDDATITTAVKSKLAADRVATLTSVDVDTVRGTVYLTGIVPDAAAKLRAQEIAQQVNGVNNVINNLKTKSSAAGDVP